MKWKPLHNWPYEISDMGQIRNMRTQHVLIPMRCGQKRKQYSVVRLCDAGRQKDFKVHVLVLETFIGPRPKGTLALHKNDDTHNNSLTNVYWGTHADNERDARYTNTKISVVQSKEIKRRRLDGERGCDLAREFRISQQFVCDLHMGRS